MSGAGISNDGVMMVFDSHLFAFCIVVVHGSAKNGFMKECILDTVMCFPGSFKYLLSFSPKILVSIGNRLF